MVSKKVIFIIESFLIKIWNNQENLKGNIQIVNRHRVRIKASIYHKAIHHNKIEKGRRIIKAINIKIKIKKDKDQIVIKKINKNLNIKIKRNINNIQDKEVVRSTINKVINKNKDTNKNIQINKKIFISNMNKIKSIKMTNLNKGNRININQINNKEESKIKIKNKDIKINFHWRSNKKHKNNYHAFNLQESYYSIIMQDKESV